MAFRVLGISWMGVGTDRYDDTFALFRDVLGLDVEVEVEQQAILATPAGQQVELFGRDGPGKTSNTPPTIAFEVDDFDAAREELANQGVELVGTSGAWENQRWQYFRSPDGYLLSIKTTGDAHP